MDDCKSVYDTDTAGPTTRASDAGAMNCGASVLTVKTSEQESTDAIEEGAVTVNDFVRPDPVAPTAHEREVALNAKPHTDTMLTTVGAVGAAGRATDTVMYWLGRSRRRVAEASIATGATIAIPLKAAGDW